MDIVIIMKMGSDNGRRNFCEGLVGALFGSDLIDDRVNTTAKHHDFDIQSHANTRCNK